MKPGPDIDALVAEKVMGCTVQTRPIIQHYKEDGVEKKRDGTGYSCGCPRENESFAPHGVVDEDGRWSNWGLPEYSSDIRAAWEVVEKAEVVAVAKCPDGWVVDCRMAVGVVAPTAPHAICLAALRSAGVSVS